MRVFHGGNSLLHRAHMQKCPNKENGNLQTVIPSYASQSNQTHWNEKLLFIGIAGPRLLTVTTVLVVYLYANHHTQVHKTFLEFINFSLHNRVHHTSIDTNGVVPRCWRFFLRATWKRGPMERACVKGQGLKLINTLAPESQVSVQAERKAVVQNTVAVMSRKSWAVN